MVRPRLETVSQERIVPVAKERLFQAHIDKLRSSDGLVRPDAELIEVGKSFHQFSLDAIVSAYLLLAVEEVEELSSIFLDVATQSTDDKLSVLFGSRVVQDPVKREIRLFRMAYELSSPRRISHSAVSLNEGIARVFYNSTVYKGERGYALSKTGLRKAKSKSEELDRIQVYQPLQNDLLTHALSLGNPEQVFDSGVVSRYGALGPVALSRNVVSLLSSKGVFVFEPEVLLQAGYGIWSVSEGVDADVIQEVRSAVSIPLFLASGYFSDDCFPFDDQSVRGSSFADEHHDSCARGHRFLSELARS